MIFFRDSVTTWLMTTHKQVLRYLQKHGDLKSDTSIERIFVENLQYYFNGTLSRAFLSALADQLLYQGLLKNHLAMDRKLFNALMNASELSSVSSRKELTKLHRKLQSFIGKQELSLAH